MDTLTDKKRVRRTRFNLKTLQGATLNKIERGKQDRSVVIYTDRAIITITANESGEMLISDMFSSVEILKSGVK